MSKIATLNADGFYDLSEPFSPYRDGLSFGRIAIHVQNANDSQGTWVMGLVLPQVVSVAPGEEPPQEMPAPPSPQEHPAPLLQTPLVMEPAAALAVLGYTLG